MTKLAGLLSIVQIVLFLAIPSRALLQQSGSSTALNPSSSDIFTLLRNKAESGDASAARELAEAYEKGNGVGQSDELAAKWYQKAADEGDVISENRLGVMYSLGRGVEKNKEEAVRWYHRAARRGNASAMFNLGAAYYNGEGVASNLDLAYAWFVLAREAGSSEAKDAVPRTATEMRSTADALEDIGVMYEQGNDLPQDFAEAARWYGEAAKQSDHAKVRLAQMLIDGRGVARDYPKALSLCRAATERKNGAAEYCLGYLYENGFGAEKNPKEATKWYELAAITGTTSGTRRAAALALAQMHLNADSDRVGAYYWLVVAYKNGAAEAKNRCQALWPQMNKGEIKKLENKLRDSHLDPKKVFDVMQQPQ